MPVALGRLPGWRGADVGGRRVHGVLPEVVGLPRGDLVQQVWLGPAMDTCYGRPVACAVLEGKAWLSLLGRCARYQGGVVDRPWVQEDVRNGLPLVPVRAMGVCDG